MSIQPYIDDPAVKEFNRDQIKPSYDEAHRTLDDDYPVWSARAVYDHGVGNLSWDASCAKHLRECREALGLNPPLPPVEVPTSLRVDNGRLRNDAGYLHWRGVSEFSAVHLCRTSQEAEFVRRLDRDQAAGRLGIRVLMMKAPQTNSTPAWNAFDLAPSMPGYWPAADRVVELAAQRGMYVEACLFADAQIVMPDMNERRAVTAAFSDWCRQHPTVLPQLSNEPFKNGWDSATDPALLSLAGLFRSNYNGRPFSIGDPHDTAETVNQEFDQLGTQSSVLVLHPDRSSSSQWARWVDHLKGWADYANPSACYRIHDEPMGAASYFEPGKRDNRPEAHLAAALVSAICGLGFTYHYISEQDDATPGLDLCAMQALIPATPDFVFRNSGTGGACVTSFSGFDKVRTCDNGSEAWAVGYGPSSHGSASWASGWQPSTVWQGQNVVLWKATR